MSHKNNYVFSYRIIFLQKTLHDSVRNSVVVNFNDNSEQILSDFHNSFTNEFKAECKCICEDTTYSSSLKQSENSPAFWYFFFGCGGKLLRSRFASGVVMVTGRLPAAEYRGELERDVASDSLVTQYHYHQHQQQHYHHTHCLHSCLRL